MTDDGAEAETVTVEPPQVARHLLLDICFHWLAAISVLILLVTGFLPIIGFKFAWVMSHWVAGMLLALLVLLHIVRAWCWQSMRSMFFGLADFKQIIGSKGQAAGISNGEWTRPDKYSPPQKLMHHGVTILIIATIVTGSLMMVKIDTPWWQRDLYWLSAENWGIVYVAHGFAALFLLSVVMIHIYFALRPEKRAYLRSMISTQMVRQEISNQHDSGKRTLENREPIDGE
jgi:cytochrome b subunit of formate dehydrogenase